MTLAEAIIKQTLAEHGPLTRSEVVELADVKWTTAYDTLNRMHTDGKVRRQPVPSGKGRPPVYWILKRM